MTQEELNYIKDFFSQILDDIRGNPDWYDAAKAIASDLGTMEKQLEERVAKLPSNLNEAAETKYPELWKKYPNDGIARSEEYFDLNEEKRNAFKAGAEWMAGQGWISVDESLPKMDEEVIVLKDILVADGLKVGFGQIAFGHIVDVNRCIDYNGWNIPGVKYWMPCPKIPGMND